MNPNISLRKTFLISSNKIFSLKTQYQAYRYCTYIIHNYLFQNAQSINRYMWLCWLVVKWHAKIIARKENQTHEGKWLNTRLTHEHCLHFRSV